MRRVAAAVLTGLALGATPASAAAQTAGGAVTSFGVGEWFGLILRLGLVIGVIWAAVYAMRWYTRRAGGDRPGATRAIEIVETRSMGPNRALHLVRIGGRAVLIGVTPERINALIEIDDPEVLDGLDLPGRGTFRPATAFSALLAGFRSVSKSAPSETSEAVRSTTSRLGGLRGFAFPARPPRDRPLVDRVLAMLGFTPVEPSALADGRMPVAGRATPMTSRVETAPPTVPTPRGVSASLPVLPATSAAQALRARSGYQAAQQSLPVGPDLSERDARIAEAQRAIAGAWQKAG